MKKSSQIIDSPVISIANGREVGTVSDLVVNPDQRTVDFILVKTTEERVGEEIIAIPFQEALGVGEYAVTILDAGAFLDLSKLNIASDLLAKDVTVINTKVLTKRGRLLGTVTEYLIDQDTGSIPFVTFVPPSNSEDMAIPLEAILSFGQQVLVVEEDVESKLLSLDELIGEVPATTIEKPEVTEPVAAPEPIVQPASSEPADLEPAQQPDAAPTEEDAPVNDDPPEEAEQQKEEESATSVELFIQRQKSFLLGKKLKHPVTAEDGKIIAPAGATITEDVFEQVYELGRQKIIELTMQAE